MSYTFPHDIQHQVDQLMATGAFSSQDELLRQAMSNLVATQDDLLAVAASLKDYDGGERGCCAEDSLAAIRSKLGLHS